MTPAWASESAATPNDAPAGTVTRTGRPVTPPQPAAATTATATIRRQLVRRKPTGSARSRERMLQQHRSSQSIHVSLAMPSRAAHLANGAQGGCGGEALVD